MKKFLLLCAVGFAFSCAWAQERTVSGRVTSTEDGSPLPGVNVVIKGTTNGTVTDSDGSYKLGVPSQGGALIFSFIGLQTQEVAIGDRAVVDVSLALDVTQLSEIVITGTGVATDKKKLAIAVESVSSDKLPLAPTASIDQALVGKIAGAQISSIDGTPGSRLNILLRGVNTINRSTSPMILVDGIQMYATNLNSLDLNAVERVEVVQGAAAATIYGAQGANGVIQVFTKKGTQGKVNIDFSTSVSQNTLLNIGDLRKSKFHNFATNANGELIDGGGNVITLNPSSTTFTYSGNVVYNALDPAGKFDKPYAANLPYIDHFDRYLVAANSYNHSLSISGGKDKVNYAISAGRNKQESNFKGDGYNERTNFTSNIGFEAVKGLEIRSITQLVYTKNTVNYFNTQGYGGSGVIYNLLNTRPFVDYDAKDIDGNYGYRLGDAAGVNGRNPNYRYQFSDRAEDKVDVIQNLAVTYKLPKYIELSAKYGLNYQTSDDRNVIKNQSAVRSAGTGNFVSIYNSTAGGEITTFSYKTIFQNFLTSVTGTIDFDEDLGLNIPIKSYTLATFDWRKSVDTQYWTYGLNLPTFEPYNGSQASTFRIQSDFKTPFITYGYLINQKFEYKDLAGISGGFRSDYSSAFGAGSKPFTFPRGDAFLRVSSLNFWESTGLSNTIIEFKLRAAYGQAGIQPRPFDRYQTLGTRVLGNSVGLYLPAGQPNPGLNVEVSEETEIGTDISLDLLKGNWLKSMNLSATYWTRETKNAIYDVDAAPSTGVGTIKDNAFSLGSKGFQFTLNTNILEGNNLKWGLTTNFGKQYSEITSVKGDGEVVLISNAGSSNYVLRAGEAIGQLYGYKMLTSVTQTRADGTPYIPVANQANYEVASTGIVVDKTTKQPLATNDLHSLGNAFPKFNMSFINDITFKDYLTFSVQLDWVYKSHLYNQTKSWLYRDGIHSDYENPVTINGESGAWTAYYRGIYQAGASNGTKDYFYEDATFLRLRNVSLGLDIDKLVDLSGFTKLQLVFTGRNLWTATKYTGMDPEISSGSVNSAWDRGVDHSTLPNFKSYQATLNIGF